MNKPSTLLVFLSDRCNMVCDYCFLDLNHGAATLLDASLARRAMREHWERVAPAEASVYFLGGEPLAHWDLLLDLAGYARRSGPAGLRLKLSTNGTLLDAPRLHALRELDVDVALSVDGAEAAHDGHRRLYGGQPSYARSLAGLAAPERAGVRANLVLSPDTAAGLAANVEALRRAGLRRLAFHLDVRGVWDGAALLALEAGLNGFERYWLALQAAAPGALTLAHLDSYTSFASDRDTPEPEHAYEDLVLGADGAYYACDGFLAARYGSAASLAGRVGDAAAGVDWAARERLHAQARDFIHTHQSRRRHYSCPRETYFQARVTGSDPAAAVEAFDRADVILGDALTRLSRTESKGASHV